MRSSRLLILTAALVLGAAMSVVPLRGRRRPGTEHQRPGSLKWRHRLRDRGRARRERVGGRDQGPVRADGGSLSDSVIATAAATYYGWIAEWNSTTVADGTYTLQSVAIEGSTSATSPGISITVSNGAPSVSIVLPSSGATLTGSQWLDAFASPGVTSVEFNAFTGTPGVCPHTLPGPGGICPIGSAVPTEYGWLIDWDTTQVPNAYYSLMAGARYPNGALGISSFVGVSVVNPGPTVVVPANNSTVSGSQWLDCTIPSRLTGPVQFGVLNSRGFPQVLGKATATEYGWLNDWNTRASPTGPIRSPAAPRTPTVLRGGARASRSRWRTDRIEPEHNRRHRSGVRGRSRSPDRKFAE